MRKFCYTFVTLADDVLKSPFYRSFLRYKFIQVPSSALKKASGGNLRFFLNYRLCCLAVYILWSYVTYCYIFLYFCKFFCRQWLESVCKSNFGVNGQSPAGYIEHNFPTIPLFISKSE